nr:unnamed protein product [Digitaria exilis]
MPQNFQPKASIFICHGIITTSPSLYNWFPLPNTATRLVRAGYGVYGIDHEGHGRSSGRRCYIPNFNSIVTDCSDYFTSICGMN